MSNKAVAVIVLSFHISMMAFSQSRHITTAADSLNFRIASSERNVANVRSLETFFVLSEGKVETAYVLVAGKKKA